MLFFNKDRLKKKDAQCQYLKPITTKASSVLSLYSIVMSSDCILYLNVLLDKKIMSRKTQKRPENEFNLALSQIMYNTCE